MERPLTGPQPLLGAGYVNKELQLYYVADENWTGERQNVVVRIGLRHVGDVAQPQLNGRRLDPA